MWPAIIAAASSLAQNRMGQGGPVAPSPTSVGGGQQQQPMITNPYSRGASYLGNRIPLSQRLMMSQPGGMPSVYTSPSYLGRQQVGQDQYNIPNTYTPQQPNTVPEQPQTRGK